MSFMNRNKSELLDQEWFGRAYLYVISLLLAVWMVAGSPSDSLAQYFGKNKVQYEDFNFQVLHTKHFDIYHYPIEFKAIDDLGGMAERWYRRHSKTFYDTFTKNPLVIYANHADFQQTNVIQSRLSVGTGGVTEGLRKRVVMPFAESNASTNHVLGHELVHVFQYDIAKSKEYGGLRATSKLPTWFIEGMAEYLSLGPRDALTAMWMRDAVLNDELPTIKEVSENRKYFPYRYGQAIWAYITGRWGDDTVRKLYKEGLKKGLNNAFKDVLGASIDSVSTLWRQATISRYKDMGNAHKNPSETGEPVLTPDKGAASMNVSPSVSPNGKYIAYISRGDLFSLDVFIANAHTGKVIRKITSSQTDAHLNALRFIESSGTWSPDSKKFAFTIFSEGDNMIRIVDVKSGDVTKKLHFDKIGSITNPAWSPDGNKLAFAGSEGGYSDLYLYDFRADSVHKLTNDKYSDLQPSWSPDGNEIAFISDRGSITDFSKEIFGRMGIAIYHMNEGSIDLLPKFSEGKHINPHYSPDGNSIFFVADPDGIDNVYRYDLQNGNAYKVTDVNTGISGISKLSPALTVARKTGRMLVSVFHNTHYLIYGIEPDSTHGTKFTNGIPTADAAQLPPIKNNEEKIVSTYISNPKAVVPADSTYKLTDYHPKLSLDYIGGGAGVGISTNQFGSGVAGGINMSFSDMLNHYVLNATVRAQGTLKDISGQVSFLNQDHRFIYGASLSHFAYRTTGAFFSTDSLNIHDNTVQTRVINQLNRRIFQDRASLLGIYPFSRNLRFESSVGYTRISYDYELRQSYLAGSSIIKTDRQSLQTPSALNLVSASAALVGDNSVNGFTGPINGHRFRFELEPTTGSMSYLTATADYRDYSYVKPVTFAFRLLHMGRYLGDSDSNRLRPQFLGYESLVRGYNIQSFNPGECTSGAGNNCPELDRLVGSRIGVANFEVRYPLLGIKPLALFKSHKFPTTLTAFFDSGVAWNSNSLPDVNPADWKRQSSKRIPVFSTGVSARVNVFGYLIAELYYAFPFQRPQKGGYIGFHISPGW